MISDMTCREFTEVLASSSPIPGGGSSSAFLAAISASLANMVGSLTVGKPKFANIEEELREWMTRADELRCEFLELIEEDANAFQALIKAFAMPKETLEQQKERDDCIEACLHAAATPPLETIRRCKETIELCGKFAEKGSKYVISDAGVGAVLCRAAMQGAALNVYANTTLMRDKETAQAMNDEADRLMFVSSVRADEIYGRVYLRMHP